MEKFDFGCPRENNNTMCDNLCKPNHRHEQFDRVVATWQTVRHYDVKTHDTFRPMCSEMKDDGFEECIGKKCCHSKGC